MVPSSFMISQMTAGRLAAGEARQIDGAFGLSGAHQHAAAAGAQRKDVSGHDQVLGARAVADRRLDGRGAIGRGDAVA